MGHSAQSLPHFISFRSSTPPTPITPSSHLPYLRLISTNTAPQPPRGEDRTTPPANSPSPDTPTTASTIAPIPRGTNPRPRPMSLPPQAFMNTYSGTSSDRTRQYVEQPHATPPKHSQRTPDSAKPRTTNRILGDYTLSKTLGAGSMGKVKLAHHNMTGEKVCDLSLSLISTPASQHRIFI